MAESMLKEGDIYNEEEELRKQQEQKEKMEKLKPWKPTEQKPQEVDNSVKEELE